MTMFKVCFVQKPCRWQKGQRVATAIVILERVSLKFHPEVPMKLKSGMWNADVDFDLAAFHSLVRLAAWK